MIKILPFLFLVVLAQSAFLPKKEENAEVILTKIDIDWQALVECIKEAHAVFKDIFDLIKLVENKQWDDAVGLLQKLIGEGNQLIKKCLKIIKKETNLKTDWEKSLTCLLGLGSEIPKVKELIHAIKTGNILRAIALIGEVGGAIAGCLRYV